MISTINPEVLVPLVSSVPVVTSEWKLTDYLGTFRVRWGIKRNSYRVNPGIYKIGKPDKNSDVFVTANYKLSFDLLRRNLAGISAWILVLDTKGINVWCAAGKGTFGNEELIRRIKLNSLGEIVSHRRIILPQLGAVGVAAHIVKKATGFRIIYGPVRAEDLPAFIKNGYKAKGTMRAVRFNLYDRLKLVPVELIVNKKFLLLAFAIVLVLSGIDRGGISFSGVVKVLPGFIYKIVAAYLAGLVLSPLLLPYLPARSFSLKGFYTGILALLFILIVNGFNISLIEAFAWSLIIPAGSSFLSLNFTGASTYTSLSGVKKEMKIALPLQITGIAAGLIFLLTSRFIEL